jgi:PPOX class probable F420-dependent enzyme
VNVDEAKRFIADNHNAVLITKKKDGGVQSSPITLGIDGDGKAVISSRETAYKVKNLRRDNWAVACVLNARFYGAWAQIEGPVEIVELPEAMDGLVDYYRRISGEHPDWDDYRAAMERDQRVLLRIDIQKAGPTRAG